MSAQGQGHRAGGGMSSIWAALGTILVLEVIADILLLPADEILIPAEGVGDVVFLLVSVVGMWSGKGSSGRQIRTTKRGVVGRGLRGNTRALAQHSWIGVVAIWAFFLTNLGLQLWFVVHHPILTILLLPFTVIFDVILLILCLVWTAGWLIPVAGGAISRSTGRQVGR